MELTAQMREIIELETWDEITGFIYMKLIILYKNSGINE